MSPAEGWKIVKHSKWWSHHRLASSVSDSQQPFRHANPQEHKRCHQSFHLPHCHCHCKCLYA